MCSTPIHNIQALHASTQLYSTACTCERRVYCQTQPNCYTRHKAPVPEQPGSGSGTWSPGLQRHSSHQIVGLSCVGFAVRVGHSPRLPRRKRPNDEPCLASRDPSRVNKPETLSTQTHFFQWTAHIHHPSRPWGGVTHPESHTPLIRRHGATVGPHRGTKLGRAGGLSTAVSSPPMSHWQLTSTGSSRP